VATKRCRKCDKNSPARNTTKSGRASVLSMDDSRHLSCLLHFCNEPNTCGSVNLTFATKRSGTLFPVSSMKAGRCRFPLLSLRRGEWSDSRADCFIPQRRSPRYPLIGVVGPRGEFRPRQTRQLPRTVDLKGRLLSCQSY